MRIVPKVGVGVVGVVMATFVFAVGSSPSASALTSATTINQNVPGGVDLITALEASAYRKNQAAVSNCGDTRACLNTPGQAYSVYTWISPSRRPAASSSTFPSTVRNVDLQLNIFQFLPVATTATGTGTRGIGTINYATDNALYVTANNFPNDHKAARSPAINAVARTAIKTKVYGARVTSGPGSLTGSTTGYIGFTQNLNSRYWFGNSTIQFKYVGPAEWVDARNYVTIQFDTKTISQYGNHWECPNPNNPRVALVTTNPDNCILEKVPYTMTFIVTPVWILSPRINDLPNVAAVGESIIPKLSVVNTGKGYSENTTWAVSAMVYDRDATVPASETTSDNNGYSPASPRMDKPCQHFQTLGATSCTTEQSSSSPGQVRQNFDALTEENVNGNHTISVRNYPVGTKVCYALSIYSRDNGDVIETNFRWAHSVPMCLIIGKKPKVQITGSDLIVGTGSATAKDVSTASSQKAIAGVQKVFGSWVEYGIAATGKVTTTASGAGYSGGGSTIFCAASLLTFSNTTGSPPSCSPAVVGSYRSTKNLPNIASRLTTSKSKPITGDTFDVGAADKGIYSSLNRTADLTVVSSATITKGKWVVIYVPKAKVIIGSNINYTNNIADPLLSAADIPQVLIIADSIDIPGGVGQIDSWLIATGEHGVINTCNDVAVDAPLTVNICNNKLTVNGPVVSKLLYLRRTSGSEVGASSGDPAEVFNLRPDAYLWATEWSAAAGRLQTVYTKELPPRF